MTGVLILAHGSRRGETEETLEAVAGLVRARLPELPLETAFMEFSEQTIERGLEALLAAGADELVAVPYFLFDGVHIREDIPEALAAFERAHPGVRVRLGRTPGADERLADLLCDRVREAL